MKKLVLILAMGILSISTLMAQSAADKIFDKYNGKDGFTVVTMTSAMFDMIAKMDTTESGKEMAEMARSIDRIRILAADTVLSGVNLYSEMMDVLPKNDFQELMSVKENDMDVTFMINEKDGKVAELLMIVGGSKEDNAIISITGDIDLAKMGSMARSMNIKGMEQLEHLGKKHHDHK
jgi:hypothetical protein